MTFSTWLDLPGLLTPADIVHGFIETRKPPPPHSPSWSMTMNQLLMCYFEFNAFSSVVLGSLLQQLVADTVVWITKDIRSNGMKCVSVKLWIVRDIVLAVRTDLSESTWGVEFEYSLIFHILGTTIVTWASLTACTIQIGTQSYISRSTSEIWQIVWRQVVPLYADWIQSCVTTSPGAIMLSPWARLSTPNCFSRPAS
jgi:hypothetical protein